MPKIDPELPIKPYQLDDLDKRIIQLKFTYPGISQHQIADFFNISQATVSLRVNRPAFIAAWDEFMMPADQFFRKRLSAISKRYYKLMESKNDKVVEQVCRTILTSYGVLKVGGDGEESDAFDIQVIRTPNKTIEIRPRDVIEIGDQSETSKDTEVL